MSLYCNCYTIHLLHVYINCDTQSHLFMVEILLILWNTKINQSIIIGIILDKQTVYQRWMMENLTSVFQRYLQNATLIVMIWKDMVCNIQTLFRDKERWRYIIYFGRNCEYLKSWMERCKVLFWLAVWPMCKTLWSQSPGFSWTPISSLMMELSPSMERPSQKMDSIWPMVWVRVDPIGSPSR